MRWLALVAVAGCYDPDPEPCVVACVDSGECPGSLECNRGVCGSGCSNACAGHSTGLLPNLCFDPVPATPQLPMLIDTDSTDGTCATPLFDPHVEVCIIAGEAIKLADTIGVTGRRPLVLWSASTIEISGILDASSHGNQPGPGADDKVCVPIDGNRSGTSLDPQLGSGGCGASFAGTGGSGGAARGAGGEVLASTCQTSSGALDRVRGGCKGGDGGISNSVGSLNGGHSGGGVYLMAAGAISISGAILANGSSGRTANANAARMAGGGGGGSGGLIGLDARTIELAAAILMAAGGGGSSGAGLDPNGPMAIQGNTGHNPETDPPAFAAPSSQTVPNNDGGGGDIDGDPGGDVIVDKIGGGGGGAGGVGYIVVFPARTLDVSSSMLVPAIGN